MVKGHTALDDLLLAFHALDKELKSISVIPGESKGNRNTENKKEFAAQIHT